MACVPYLEFGARLHVPVYAVTFGQKLQGFFLFFFLNTTSHVVYRKLDQSKSLKDFQKKQGATRESGCSSESVAVDNFVFAQQRRKDRKSSAVQMDSSYLIRFIGNPNRFIKSKYDIYMASY